MSLSLSNNNPSQASGAYIASKASKVLIITYYWPPSGGAGVQRWLKFSKYLPELGWEPVILTVDAGYAAYPVTDYSLLKEIPPSLKVYSTPATDYFSVYKNDRSKIPTAGFANSLDSTIKGRLFRFIRGNFFIPDPRRGWNRFAFKKACELIERDGIKHIITTSPPHSTQLIGLKISKKYPWIKWIADLRDPWTGIYYYNQFYPTQISKWIDSAYERRVLKKADKLITVGISLKNMFSLRVKGIENKTEVITNGYDEEDFKGIDLRDPFRFTITYAGTLSDNYPVNSLITALSNLKTGGMDFTLRFVGTVTDKIRKLLLSEIHSDSVEFVPYVIHSEAIKFIAGSTVLVLIIPDHQSNKSIITGKLFEYMATGKPILCLGPVDGDAAVILKQTGLGRTFDYDDISGINDFFMNLAEIKARLKGIPASAFSRKNLTLRIASILEEFNR